MGLIVVTGPPAGGKSTWVRAHAQPGDIVIDYDLITAALTAPDTCPYDQPRHIRSTVFRARSAAIAEAFRHLDTCDVYVIHTAPRPEAMATYRRLGARVVTVDPGKQVVLARCQAERPDHLLDVALRWYRDLDHSVVTTPARTSRDW